MLGDFFVALQKILSKNLLVIGIYCNFAEKSE